MCLLLCRGLLRAAALPYGLVVRARNGLYDMGWLPARRAEVPVISVGNITAGGTGKTPLVAWLARLLVIRRCRPAVLSRGYGRDRETGIDDENMLLRRQAPDVPVVVDADRVAAARTAVQQHGADVVVLDDGFQHRPLARDLDLVLVDAVWPFGAEHLLPRGLLREPLGGLRRADFILITRSNLVSGERLDEVKKRLGELAPEVPRGSCRIQVEELRLLGAGGPDGRADPVLLSRGSWAAFCGVGNPEGFRMTLGQAGCRPRPFRVFPDHHSYAGEQVAALLQEAGAAGCDYVATTGKDAVKVEPLLAELPGPPVYSVQTDLEFAEGAERLTAEILEAVGQGQ